ncbi:MAG: hypothetical protein ACLP50_02750 [Solirubrobacteraceae bacterium]
MGFFREYGKGLARDMKIDRDRARREFQRRQWRKRVDAKRYGPAGRPRVRVSKILLAWAGLVLIIGALVLLGKVLAVGAPPSRAEVREALAQWVRNDRHCKQYIDTTNNPGYPTICTPPGMRSGFFGGKLINDPMCSDIGADGPGVGYDGYTNDIPCTLPPHDPGDHS